MSPLGRVLILPLALLLPVAACATAPPVVSDVLRGYLAERAGEPDEAVAAFEQALDADPESATVRLEMARLLLSQRRFDEALEVLDRGVELRPDQPDLLLLRARVLAVRDRKTEAVEAAQAAAKHGGGAEAWALAVRLLEESGQGDGAVAEALRWAEATPKDADAQFTVGRLLLARGERDAARQALGKALQSDPNHRATLRVLAGLEEDAGNVAAAEALYRRVVDANPHDVEARFRLGQALLKQGKVDDAVQVFEAAERWSGGDPGLRFRLGVLLLQAERPADAEAVFRTMAQAHGSDSQAWYLLGLSLLAQERYGEALESFDKIPPEYEGYSDVLVRRAIALDGLERTAEARQLLEDWLREHPEDEEVILALSGLWEDDGQYREAVDLLEGYLANHDPENPRVFFTLGVLHDKLKDWRRSAEYMKRSLERTPDDPHALNYLGYTYAEQGVYLEEAEQLIRRALELKPGDGFITDSLGWVYFRQGRYREAAETLRKAVEAAPDDPVIWEHLGDALAAGGDVDEARKAYQRTLELAPENESARRKVEGL